jgi:hypothetical protein
VNVIRADSNADSAAQRRSTNFTRLAITATIALGRSTIQEVASAIPGPVMRRMQSGWDMHHTHQDNQIIHRLRLEIPPQGLNQKYQFLHGVKQVLLQIVLDHRHHHLIRTIGAMNVFGGLATGHFHNNLPSLVVHKKS